MTRRKNKKIRYIGRRKSPNFSGQHLMHNKTLLHEIVNQAKISSGDLVLDLGAGKGALTSYLNMKAKRVLAVEYDRKFVEILQQKLIAKTLK